MMRLNSLVYRLSDNLPMASLPVFTHEMSFYLMKLDKMTRSA